MRLCLSLVALLLGLTACATAPERKTEDTTSLVWPAPPDKARITFVRSFGQPDDLSFQKGFFQKIAELLFGGDQAGMVRPMAIVEHKRQLLVADPGVKGVHRFDLEAQRYDLIHAENNQPILSPVGLAVGPDGSVYITDSAQGAVFVLRHGAEHAMRLALSEPLRQPTGVAIDVASSRLYVVDTGQHCLMVYDLAGQFIQRLGQRGRGPLEFNYPTMLWRASTGNLLITDSLNFRTQVLNAEGKYLQAFGQSGDNLGDAPRQKGIAADRYGHIYVVDSLLHAVQIFGPSGQFLLSFGSLGQATGEFWLPTGIFVGEDDLIYVADSYNKRVQVFRYVGGAS